MIDLNQNVVIYFDRAETNDLKSRFLIFIHLFFFPLFQEGRENGKRITKVVILSHAFLFDLYFYLYVYACEPLNEKLWHKVFHSRGIHRERFYLLPKIIHYTVGENIIATIKMQNNFCYPFKMVIFPILLSQYWTFLYCPPFSYRSSNFAIAKVVALNLFASIFV